MCVVLDVFSDFRMDPPVLTGSEKKLTKVQKHRALALSNGDVRFQWKLDMYSELCYFRAPDQSKCHLRSKHTWKDKKPYPTLSRYRFLLLHMADRKLSFYRFQV